MGQLNMAQGYHGFFLQTRYTDPAQNLNGEQI